MSKSKMTGLMLCTALALSCSSGSGRPPGLPDTDIASGDVADVPTDGSDASTDKTPPSAPAHLLATSTGPTSIGLTWDPSDDNVGVSGYKIYVGTTEMVTTTGTAYSHNGLSTGQTYCYTVRAFDLDGNVSASSNEACAMAGEEADVVSDNPDTAEDVQEPLPGEFMLQSPTDKDSLPISPPMLAWSPSENAVSYLVEISTGPEFSSLVYSSDLSDTSIVVNNVLTIGGVYYWRVTATNPGGSVVASNAPFWFSLAIPAGTMPNAVAVTPDGAFALVSHDTEPGTVAKVSLVDGSTVATIDSGTSYAWGVAVTPDGSKAVVANQSGGTICIIDLASNAPTIIGTSSGGSDLRDVAITSDGTKAVMPERIWSGNQQGVRVFNIGTNTSVKFIPIDTTGTVTGIAVGPDNKTALVTTYNLTTTLIKVDLDTDVVTSIPDVGPSYGVAINPLGTVALVTSGLDASVKRVTIADNVVTATIPFLLSNTDFHNIAFTPDGSRAVVVGQLNCAVLSLATNSVEAMIPYGGSNVAITPDGKRALVTDAGSSVLRVIGL